MSDIKVLRFETLNPAFSMEFAKFFNQHKEKFEQLVCVTEVQLNSLKERVNRFAKNRYFTELEKFEYVEDHMQNMNRYILTGFKLDLIYMNDMDLISTYILCKITMRISSEEFESKNKNVLKPNYEEISIHRYIIEIFERVLKYTTEILETYDFESEDHRTLYANVKEGFIQGMN